MRFDIVTLMPGMFNAIVDFGVSGRAVEQGAIQIECHNPREHTTDRHNTVDDRPYGGGPGMVMKAEPLLASINAVKAQAAVGTKVAYLSPQGKTLTQADACELAQRPGMILLAGRYEGVDERLLEAVVDEEWSIGDYVLSGGELGAMVLIDAVARLLPGVLGHEQSAQQDSFMDGLLDCPHYTRPEVFEGKTVPKVLLSGNHKAIAQWRRMQALGRTQARRPELIKKRELSDQDHLLLKQYDQDSDAP